MAEGLSARRSMMERTILTVLPHEGAWAVEQAGAYSDFSSTKEEAKAAATKQARQLIDAGKPCQVVVTGELGYFIRPGHQAAAR